MTTRDDTCYNHDDAAPHRPATRTGANGEPYCERCWRDAGMYDPRQGYEPTERDYADFAAGRLGRRGGAR